MKALPKLRNELNVLQVRMTLQLRSKTIKFKRQMKEFGKKLETNIFFYLRSQIKVKIMDYHPVLPFVAYINADNNFSIWDYEKKTCLKSFNANALEIKDLSKTVALRDIKFYDKDILMMMFPYESFEASTEQASNLYKNNWIISIAETKIYFYDYVCEKVEQISALLLDNKTPRCVEFIDSKYLAIGCNDGLVKIFDTHTWSIPKTLRGYHLKPISHIFSYQQNEGNRNRLIVASNDGTMACWNADTDGPAFKFQMLKAGKPIASANNMEDITSISYNVESYQIVTVSEHYITVWSSLSGNEILRNKNFKDSNKNTIFEAKFLNNGDINKDYMIAHGKSSEVILFDVCQVLKTKEKDKESLDYITLIDFKNLRDYDKNFRIYLIKANYSKPHYFFLSSSQGVYIFTIGSALISLCNMAGNPFYTTYITPLQVKEFLNEDWSVKKMIPQMIQRCQGYELPDIGMRLPNILLLSVSNHLIQCHLIDRTKFDSMHGSSIAATKSILHKIEDIPVFEDEPEVQVSLSGVFFSVWYRRCGLLFVFAITNRNIINPDKNDNLIVLDNLHPCGSVTRVYAGAAKSFAWHQDRDEFAILQPVDKDGKLVEVREKIESISKGFFSSKTVKKTVEIDSSAVVGMTMFIISLNQITPSKIQCEIIHKSDNFKNATKVFGGPFYGIAEMITEEDFKEIITPELEQVKRDIRSSKRSKVSFYYFKPETSKLEKVAPPFLEPQNLYWNQSSAFCVACYENTTFVYKTNNLEEFLYFGTINKSIHSGYFWENLFFYITETSINLAIFDLKSGIIDIQLAADKEDPHFIVDNYLDEYLMKNENYIEDTIHPHIQRKPHGHLKIIGLYDYRLLIVNSREEFFTLELYHPFTKFMMFLQFDNIKDSLIEVEKMDPKTYATIYEILRAYGYNQQAEDLIGKVKDPEIVALCALKKTFYEDAKQICSDPQKATVMESSLVDHLALETYLLKDQADISENAFFKMDELNALDIIHKEERSAELLKNNPGIQFYLGLQVRKKNLEVSELLDKLVAM